MNEDYASYELAVKLKAAGFDEPCDKWIASKSFSYYDEDECCDHNAVIRKGWLISQKQKEKYDQEALPYLSLWHAQKWLREKHHISVRVSYIAYHKVWFADWLNLDSGEFDDTDATFATYEEAMSDGIASALELIKKGE